MHLRDDDSQPEGGQPAPRNAIRDRVADRFILQQLLGIGASGAVYRAYDEERAATVALKFLTELDPESVFRFKSEFRALANLSHPNLLQLYELLSAGSDWLLSMELVEGTNFLHYLRPKLELPVAARLPDEETEVATEVSHETLLRQTNHGTNHGSQPSAQPVAFSIAPGVQAVAPLDETKLRRAFLQLCEGLHALHRAERLHRDLKPANVLVAHSDARVVICDFGLTLAGRRRNAAVTPELTPAGDSLFPTPRHVAGTPAYMSPEQAQAQPLTAASDWYAVGVMLYQALTGRLPYGGAPNERSLLRAKLVARPVHPLTISADLPADLAELALALLSADPTVRPGYPDAIAVFETRTQRSQGPRAAAATLIGRELQLGRLADAFDASRAGNATLALVAGLSGMGKSALVDHFLSGIEDAGALVLRARCYEREELPYKAIDPLVDALSSHLMQLPAERANALLPDGIAFLATMFPALKRVPAVAEREAQSPIVTDPRERRRRAFGAFRELCRNLAREQPLAIFIDDLQWGDRDSAPLFRELLTPPGAPPVLIVCAYRREDERRSPLVLQLRDAPHEARTQAAIEISVGALEPNDAARLARMLLPQGLGAGAAAERIAREAEGNPFFVGELAQYVAEHDASAAAWLRLDALIVHKLNALSPESLSLLSAIALAGRPVSHSTLRSVTQLGAATFKALRDLEGRRLALCTRTDGEERAECYHDRIRETVCEGLAPERARELHRALAEVLETEPVEDCDALLEHWRGAGEREKACRYALRGAERAEAALAFAHAADLYRQALSLMAAGAASSRDVQERLGQALILAGRGAEAAAVFSALIAGASPDQALRFRMLATTQLLRSGKLAEGFAELERADDLFGVRFPRSEASALLGLVSRQLQIRLKESKLRLRETDRATGELSARLEALWEVAAAVSSADFLRGSVYGAELMLRAIDLGDPSHVAGGCGLEAVSAAAANKHARVDRMCELAERAGNNVGALHLMGRVKGMQAICRQLQGRWVDAQRLARESQELQLRGARTNWDHAIMIWWELTSVAQIGLIGELVRRVPEGLRDAEARGDVYAATSFRTHRMSWAWLGMDAPDLADRQVDVAEREWIPSGYQFQHWHMTYARSEIDLYRGTPKRSLDRLVAEWRRARLVRQVAGVRCDMLYTRARLYLAAALTGGRREYVARAQADGQALLRENVLWSDALGRAILAAAATFEHPERGLRLLASVERMFLAADMQLHAEACRARRAQLDGDTPLLDAAFSRMRELGMKRPEGFLDMLLPVRLRGD